MKDFENDYTPQYLALDPKYKALRANLSRLEKQIETAQQTSAQQALQVGRTVQEALTAAPGCVRRQHVLDFFVQVGMLVHDLRQALLAHGRLGLQLDDFLESPAIYVRRQHVLDRILKELGRVPVCLVEALRRDRLRGRKVGLTLCGGNVDSDVFARVLAGGTH